MIVEREREMRPTIREQEEDEARLRREEQEEEWKGREEGKRGESVVFDHYGVGFVRPSSLALPAFLLNAVWRSLLLTTVPSRPARLVPVAYKTRGVMALCFRW
jgi:hypothetical protein